MKKIITGIGIVLALIFAGGYVLRNVNLNHIGKDEYYTQIVDKGSEVESEDNQGNVYIDYEYQFSAYNEAGDKKTVTFTAQKELRQEAYLKIYLKDEDVVTSYEEVQKDELPVEAAKNLE